jgi:uncharacterized protein YjdB
MQRWQNESQALSFKSKEEYFSRPIKTSPLYLIDYKPSVKIIRAQAGDKPGRETG